MTRPRYDPGIQALALGLREVVHQELAPCHEYIFEMRSKVVLLYGATERVIAHGICNIHVFARHVLLGFPRGTDLDDPAGVLQGTGKGMRHITVKKLSIWIGRRYGRTFARPGSTRPHTASSNG